MRTSASRCLSLLPAALAVGAIPWGVARAQVAGECRYHVSEVEAVEMVIDVAIACPPDVERFTAPPNLANHVERFVEEDRELPWTNGAWILEKQRDQRVTASYRLALGRMAAASPDSRLSQRVGRSVMAVAASWLAQPEPGRRPIRLTTDLPPARFATGFQPVPGGWRIDPVPLRFAGYSAFGRLRQTRLALPGRGGGPAPLRLVRLDGGLAMGDAALDAGLGAAGRAVARLMGGFPPEGVFVVVAPQAGRDGMPLGQVVPGTGLAMLLEVGEAAPAAVFRDDGVAVHELIHIVTPFLPDSGPWLMEGLATYYEPLARARAGWLAPEDLWTRFRRALPRGLPALTRDGLRRADSFGVYWGGALFMMMADLEARRRTGGRLGIEDCLRDLAAKGVDARTRMTAADFAARCDAVTGVEVLRPLLAAHLDKGREVDLEALFQRLGVDASPAGAVLRPDAPWSLLRDVTVWGGLERPAPLAYP